MCLSHVNNNDDWSDFRKEGKKSMGKLKTALEEDDQVMDHCVLIPANERQALCEGDYIVKRRMLRPEEVLQHPNAVRGRQ